MAHTEETHPPPGFPLKTSPPTSLTFQDPGRGGKAGIARAALGVEIFWIKDPPGSSEVFTPQSRFFWRTRAQNCTFPAARDLASLRLWQDVAIFTSPTSQVNKLETDRKSIIW